MALRDIFKKKKKEPERKPEAKKEKEIKKPKPEEKKEPAKAKSDKSELAYRVLKFPHISEKAGNLVKINQYVFRVYPDSDKTKIKRTIEELYGVNVSDVKIINNPSKKRRLGRFVGKRKAYKKAIVKIKEGQKIEVLPR